MPLESYAFLRYHLTKLPQYSATPTSTAGIPPLRTCLRAGLRTIVAASNLVANVAQLREVCLAPRRPELAYFAAVRRLRMPCTEALTLGTTRSQTEF